MVDRDKPVRALMAGSLRIVFVMFVPPWAFLNYDENIEVSGFPQVNTIEPEVTLRALFVYLFLALSGRVTISTASACRVLN